MSDLERQVFAVQFHPELEQTENKGWKMLRRFLFEVCRCKGQWNMKAFVEDAVLQIKEIVGNKKVLCALRRRRRFIGCCCTAPSSDWRWAYMCVCRSRSLAKGRGGKCDAYFC